MCSYTLLEAQARRQRSEVLMTKKQALLYLEVGMIEITTLANRCSRPDCWSGSSHLLYWPPQVTVWVFLTRRQETSAEFLAEHHQHGLWALDLISYGCSFLRRSLEGPCLLETEPACCHEYSFLFLHQEGKDLPWMLPSELPGDWTHTKAKLCKNRNVPMIFTLQGQSTGEKAALWMIVLAPGIDHRVIGGILHNWRARFSFCWPQCLYKKDPHVWLGRKEYLYFVYWRNCSRTVNPCENLALKCCQEQWLCCYLPCQCQAVSSSFSPHGM